MLFETWEKFSNEKNNNRKTTGFSQDGFSSHDDYEVFYFIRAPIFHRKKFYDLVHGDILLMGRVKCIRQHFIQ